MGFRVGQAVHWVSSLTRKEGVVVAVVPAGSVPRDVGYPQVGKESLSRAHESYVIKGGEPGKKANSLYWPVVSLIHASDALTAEEMAWCNANVAEVRALMARATGR